MLHAVANDTSLMRKRRVKPFHSLTRRACIVSAENVSFSTAKSITMTCQIIRFPRARLPLLAGLIGVVLSLCTTGLAQAQALDTKSPPTKSPPTNETAARQSDPPRVSAKAWAIADGKTGKVLWGLNEAEPRAIASTTKIMTALLVFRLAQDDPKLLDKELAFSPRAAAVPGSSSRLRARVSDCRCASCCTGCFCLRAMTRRLPPPSISGPHFKTGGQKEEDPVKLFITEMNRRAKELKLAETSFLDPNGLARNQASTEIWPS